MIRNSLPLVLSFLPPFLLGYSIISILLRNTPPSLGGQLLKIVLGFGVGTGLSSCLLFLWLTAVGRCTPWFCLSEAGIALGTGTCAWRKCSRRNTGNQSSPHPASALPSLLRCGLPTAFWIAIGIAVVCMGCLSVNFPHGGWDTWSIWNLRARFLFLGNDHWTDLLSLDLGVWSHADYPLLLPGIVARSWFFLGRETQLVPAVVASLMTLAVVALLATSVGSLRSRSNGYLAGLVLVGTPFFLHRGADQQADVPMSFFLLATLVLLWMRQKSDSNPIGCSIAAGITASLAAWTKNEGLLFLIALLVPMVWFAFRSPDRRREFRHVLACALGALPVLLLIAYFKIHLAPGNDLLASQGGSSTLHRLTEFSRYASILGAFERQLLHFGDCVVAPTPLLVFYLLIVGVHIEPRERPALWTTIGCLTLVLLGYFLVYLTTPNDLSWHLRTSLNRLWLQLWPSFLFLIFVAARPTENVSMKEAPETPGKAYAR